MKMRDAFVVKAWDVDKIQAHLWNSVAGINVGMGYFFYFVGVRRFVETKNGWPEVKVEVRKSFSQHFVW